LRLAFKRISDGTITRHRFSRCPGFVKGHHAKPSAQRSKFSWKTGRHRQLTPKKTITVPAHEQAKRYLGLSKHIHLCVCSSEQRGCPRHVPRPKGENCEAE